MTDDGAGQDGELLKALEHGLSELRVEAAANRLVLTELRSMVGTMRATVLQAISHQQAARINLD